MVIFCFFPLPKQSAKSKFHSQLISHPFSSLPCVYNLPGDEKEMFFSCTDTDPRWIGCVCVKAIFVSE